MHSVREFDSGSEARLFQLPIKAFPGFWVYAYLVITDDYCVLIDTGSGFGEASDHLENGLKEASMLLGETVKFEDLTHILITHAHIDHFGGLAFLQEKSDAKVGIHELDKRILTNYEERFAIISARLDQFFHEAGVSDERRNRLMELYSLNKLLFRSVPVDFTYDDIGMRLGPFEFLHVPGHSAGHVMIRMNDVVFSGDHILDDISPHQAPEHLSLSTGLDHYMNSLHKVLEWGGDVRLILPGHNKPIYDLRDRVNKIVQLHQKRLKQVLDICEQPICIMEASKRLFGTVNGYNVLLALEETGAHIEYLYQRGLLRIANLDTYLGGEKNAPIEYVRM